MIFKIFNFIKSFIYYLFILVVFTCILLTMGKYGKQSRMILTTFATIYLIYSLTSLKSPKKKWIEPDEVSYGPPIQLYYPKNPLGVKTDEGDINVRFVV